MLVIVAGAAAAGHIIYAEAGYAGYRSHVNSRAARLLISGLTLLTAILAAALAPATAALARPTAANSAPASSVAPGPVLLIGIAGLRWTDISASVTPALWRLAEQGSVGSLSVHSIRTTTCPADAWLTVNSGARATAEASTSGPCARPAVVGPPGTVGSARVPAMPTIVKSNGKYCYNPYWGVLANPARSWGCGKPSGTATSPPAGRALAIGQGAALALADPAGNVAMYAAAWGDQPLSLIKKSKLVMADLGSLPPARPGVMTSAREAALRAADREAGLIIAAVPAGARVVVAGLGDNASAQLRAVIVAGPGFARGLLNAASTRQPGLVTVTDLTSSILGWRGTAVPTGLTGSVIGSQQRGTLSSAIRTLIGQDTAVQVYMGTIGWFFLIYAVAEIVGFALLAFFLRGDEPARRRRRVSIYQAAGAFATAIPAGTFLASLLPWPQWPHPALLLYGLSLAWAVVIAGVALTGPWRRSVFGPPGFVCAVTVAVIGVDVMTGSRLQLGTPYGLSAVVAGRFYGIGNNALGVYAPAAIFCAAWAGLALLRGRNWRGRAAGDQRGLAASDQHGLATSDQHSLAAGDQRGLAASDQGSSPSAGRARAVVAAGAIALVTVIICGWPGFGTKVGGTIALVPAFLVLLAGIGGVRISPRKAILVAISGLAVIALIAAVSYAVPSIGPSDISGFVRQLLHGDALSILHRKVNANVGSLTETWFTPVVPLIALGSGAMLAWPDRLRLRALPAGTRAEPLLRQILASVWLATVLGWLADDSGVSVTAAAMTLALPLAVVLVAGFAETWSGHAPVNVPGDRAVTTDRPVRAPGSRG